MKSELSRSTTIAGVGMVMLGLLGVWLFSQHPVKGQGADRPGEWHQWRGPNRANRSPGTGLLKEWPAEGPRLLWTAKGCGKGYSSIVIGGGLVITAGDLGEDTCVIAYDLNGAQKWTAPCGKAYADGTRGTPTYDNGKVYFESALGDVVCLDARTGNRIWGLNLMGSFGAQSISWAFSESVLIDENNVICCPGGPNAAMVALEKNTGKTVWVCKGAQDKASYASPIIVDYKGLRQIVTMTSQAAIGVSAKTGELLWRHEHRTQHDANIPTPIHQGGYVFIDSGYASGGALLQLEVADGKAVVREVWRTPFDNHHGGIVLVNGYLYGSSHGNCGGGQWVCLDFKTGEVKYQDKGIGKGSVTYADGMLYTLNENGGVGLVPASPEGHRVVSRFSLPPGGEGSTWAHPVVCDGRLYIRHGDFLYAYDVEK